MLLKNKAPSLKSQINLENISTNSFNIPENTNKTSFIYRSPKEEALEPSMSHVDNIVNKFNQENDSKYCLEFNDINIPHVNTVIGVVHGEYANTDNVPSNKPDISIIDINIDELLSTDRKLPEHLKTVDIKDDNKLTNRKRKSECSLDEFNSTEADNCEIEKTEKMKRTKRSYVKRNKKINIATPKSLDAGVYVECDTCHKTRYLKDIFDPSEIPTVWTCDMEKNKTLNCNVVQENFGEPDECFIYNKYTLGSVVWAKAPGFCWWPAIIDEDPDLHMFYWCYDNSSDVSHYHVTFLDDDVSRSWVTNSDIKVFRGKSDMDSMKFVKSKKDYSNIIAKAADKAEECLKYSLQECLDKYSFAVRYNGKPNIWTKEKPKTKRKSKACLQNTESCESSEESEETFSLQKKNKIKDKNVKIDKQFDDLNKAISLMEAKSQVLIVLNQQTKHDLIVKNTTTKENKNKTQIKARKKVKNSEIFEE